MAGAAGEPGAGERLADCWLRHADQLGALLEVLDDFEGPDSEPLAALYEAVQHLTQLPIPWRKLAELKRIFPPDFVIPARLRREFHDRYPAFRPEHDFDGRPVIHSWLDRLARFPLGPDGSGPLYDFLGLLRARKTLDPGRDREVKAWLDAAPVFAWPTAAGLPAAAGLTVVIRRGRPGRFAVRAWLEVNGATTPLTDSTAREIGWDDLRKLVPDLVRGSARRIGPPTNRLRIELFLPFDRLDTDVDAWLAAGGTLGEQYQLVLRSFERAYETDEADEFTDGWRRRWEGRPMAGAGLDQNALCDSWAWAELAKPEFKAVATAHEPGVADLENLIVAGYPVAIIPRGTAAGRAQAVADLTLGPPSFDALVERVRVARGDRNHPAGPVSLLWDDPDRRPPDRRTAFVQPE